MEKRRNNDQTDPSVNDVLAQQMGTDYSKVENLDKQRLQKDLKDQGTNPNEVQIETHIPSEGAVDDRNTLESQLMGVKEVPHD